MVWKIDVKYISHIMRMKARHGEFRVEDRIVTQMLWCQNNTKGRVLADPTTIANLLDILFRLDILLYQSQKTQGHRDVHNEDACCKKIISEGYTHIQLRICDPQSKWSFASKIMSRYVSFFVFAVCAFRGIASGQTAMPLLNGNFELADDSSFARNVTLRRQ